MIFQKFTTFPDDVQKAKIAIPKKTKKLQSGDSLFTKQTLMLL